MLAEVFYKITVIRKEKNDIKFIISWDNDPPKPINNIISQCTDYANSPCLFELAVYNKVQITICRRA